MSEAVLGLLNVEAIESSNEVEKIGRQLYEVYGNNGNQLFSSEIIMDRQQEPEFAAKWALNKLAEAKLDGKMTGLVAGAFDVPQENHDWFLRHCRMEMAKKYLEENNIELTTENIRSVICSDRLFLVVNIDSDAALDNRKSNDPTKGGARRPVYGWSTRANRIAGQSFELDGVRHGVVDMVIAEGPEYKGTILEKARVFAAGAAEYELLDHYVVFDENPDDQKFALAAGFNPIVIPMELVYSYDPISGNPYKSSDIIKRIKGEENAK